MSKALFFISSGLAFGDFRKWFFPNTVLQVMMKLQHLPTGYLWQPWCWREAGPRPTNAELRETCSSLWYLKIGDNVRTTDMSSRLCVCPSAMGDVLSHPPTTKLRQNQAFAHLLTFPLFFCKICQHILKIANQICKEGLIAIHTAANTWLILRLLCWGCSTKAPDDWNPTHI